LYNAATEAICSALTVCEDTEGYLPLAQILVAEVKKLAPVFNASILSEDVDRLVLMCSVVLCILLVYNISHMLVFYIKLQSCPVFFPQSIFKLLFIT